jgi:predicted RNA binding protein YcfA (HicA-like mRNA interferase family)
MPGLPTVSGKELLRAFKFLGWREVRCEGSHHIMYKEGRIPVPINVHGNKDLKPGTLRGILQRAEISTDELRAALEEI